MSKWRTVLPNGDMRNAPLLRRLAQAFLLTLIYFAAGKLGLALASVNESVSAVWPPSGVALAGLLLLGLRAWPAIFIGALLVNVTTTGVWSTSVGIAIGNTLEGVAGAWLVHRFAGGRHAFDQAHTAFKFAILAGMVATAISATIGVTTLVIGGAAPAEQFDVIWRTWWLGDASGILVVAPLILTWAANPYLNWSNRHAAEVTCVVVAVYLLGGAVFGEWFAFTRKGHLMLFILLPSLVWVAFRFAQRETSTAILVLSAVAIEGTIRGFGPFAGQPESGSLLFLQVFLGMTAIMNMTLSAAVAERQSSELRLQAQQETTRILEHAGSLPEAVRAILQVICEKLDWEVGNFWRVAEGSRHLEFADTYTLPGVSIGNFIDVSRATHFRPGNGMPGRAWQNQDTVWVDDVGRDPNFPRVVSAQQAALHSALAFPISVDRKVIGVIEFFSREFRGSKAELISMLGSVGSQVGQFAERKRAEEALKQSEALHRTMAETASDAFLTIDVDSIILFANRAAEKTFGYTTSEMIGSCLTMLMPEEMRPRHLEGMRRYLETGQKGMPWRSIELPGRHKSGRIFPMEISFGEFEEHGRRIFTSIVRDISERKNAAAELERQKAAAENANQAKDIFLAMLSHELRAPLSPIVSAVDDLELTVHRTPEVHESLSLIRRNIEHEARLIDDLLDLSRIVKGKLELRYQPTDVHQVILDTLTACRPEIRLKNLEVRTTLEATRFHVNADPTRLQQVVWNLVRNAVKFSSEGRSVTVRSMNTSDETLELHFTDQGIGIDPEMLQRLFTPFEQGERSIRRRFGGLGLGLAISKALAEAHGGVLSATSEGEGKGATFSLALPVVEANAPSAGKDPRENKPHAALQGLRILLVDDHLDTRRALERLLLHRGYDVDSAGDVESALKLARQETFHLLISDIGLADRSGHDLLRELQSAQAIKGIAISGFGTQEDLEKSKAAGFAVHLVKPISIQALEAAIRDHV